MRLDPARDATGRKLLRILLVGSSDSDAKAAKSERSTLGRRLLDYRKQQLGISWLPIKDAKRDLNGEALW